MFPFDTGIRGSNHHFLPLYLKDSPVITPKVSAHIRSIEGTCGPTMGLTKVSQKKLSLLGYDLGIVLELYSFSWLEFQFRDPGHYRVGDYA